MPGQPPAGVRRVDVSAGSHRPVGLADPLGVHDRLPQGRLGKLAERLGPAGRVDEFQVPHGAEGRECWWRGRRGMSRLVRGSGGETGGQLFHPGIAVVQFQQRRLVRVEPNAVSPQGGEGPQYADRFQHPYRPRPREVIGEDAERRVRREHSVEGAVRDQQLTSGAEIPVGVREEQIGEPRQLTDRASGIEAGVTHECEDGRGQRADSVGSHVRIEVRDSVGDGWVTQHAHRGSVNRAEGAQDAAGGTDAGVRMHHPQRQT